MLGSRKLARLLDHAQDAGGKVVLVGDDKQLAAIEAGGGFRGLRLRLGASTLTENRRQAEPWEREAVEHLREGDIDAALSAYREHDRLVATETPGAAQGGDAGRLVALVPAGQPRGDPGLPPRRGGPVQHRLPATPRRQRPPRVRPAPGRGSQLRHRRSGRLRQERPPRLGCGQRQPRPGRRARPAAAGDDPQARGRPRRDPGQGIPGRAALPVAARQPRPAHRGPGVRDHRAQVPGDHPR